MNDRFEPLDRGEVISVQQDTQVLTGHRTFRVGELNDAIISHLENAIAGWNEQNNAWFSQQGMECEALRFGSNAWQKGRIRLCLEFCPDQTDSTTTQSATINTNTSVPVVATVAPGTPVAPAAPSNTDVVSNSHTPTGQTSTTIGDVKVRNDLIERQSAIFTPAPVSPAIEARELMGGIATVSTVVAAAAISLPDAPPAVIATLDVPSAPPATAVITAPETAAIAAPAPEPVSTVPPLADSILELEDHHSANNAAHVEELDEIAFDFDSINEHQGTMIPNGMMELDLTDLGLELGEHDFLNFESNGMPDLPQELISLQDLDQPENSGMLIDEVWNEMSQPNWPGIN